LMTAATFASPPSAAGVVAVVLQPARKSVPAAVAAITVKVFRSCGIVAPSDFENHMYVEVTLGASITTRCDARNYELESG
jgi:hypothetical protein